MGAAVEQLAGAYASFPLVFWVLGSLALYLLGTLALWLLRSWPVWHTLTGAPSSPTNSFRAIVTSTVEIDRYYYRHFTDTVTVERVAATPPS